MKNDKYYGSLRSRDYRWGVGLSLSSKHIIITTYIFLLKVCIIDRRPDRHFGIGFRPARRFDESLIRLFSQNYKIYFLIQKKIKLKFKKIIYS